MPLIIGETGVNANTSTNTTTLSRSGGATTVAFDVENSDGIALTAYTTNDAAIVGGSEGDVGVWGTSRRDAGMFGDSDEDVGVFGRSNQDAGVFGTTNSDESIGVLGRVTTDSAGVWGVVGGGAGNWPGVEGYSNTGNGVRGVSIAPMLPWSIGVVGYSRNGVGVAGQTDSSSSFGGLFIGGLVVQNGPKSAAVLHPDGTQRLLYSMESPESWFEDFGRADLVRGEAKVALDPTFAAIVHTDDYQVFLSPEGETNGLYVSSRSTVGFEVREQQRGSSDATFSYRIVAKRKDIEAPRFRKIDLPSFDAKEMERTPKGIDLSKPVKPQRPRTRPHRASPV